MNICYFETHFNFLTDDSDEDWDPVERKLKMEKKDWSEKTMKSQQLIALDNRLTNHDESFNLNRNNEENDEVSDGET